tara:strand:- start:498 stop:704 length:207 start_codon:yes stop_codon:yes gene_type:complete
MTKKIRLMDESTVTPNETDTLQTAAVNDLTTKQLMKYLEAIDWKLWEMLKIMKIQTGDPITTEKEKEE